MSFDPFAAPGATAAPEPGASPTPDATTAPGTPAAVSQTSTGNVGNLGNSVLYHANFPIAEREIQLPPDPNAALSLRNLWKRFGDKIAVADVNLDVPAGSFYGLVGPNGAGKTTTLSMATGLLRPDHGVATVLGHDVWANPVAAKRLLGVLPDGVRLFDRLTGQQLITYTGLLRGMDQNTVAARTNDLLQVMDLQADKDKFVVDYSAGMTKKVALACALIHAPRVLVLDEPFEAVDPVSAANIRDILHKYVADGGTVIISSHVMDLVQRTCSHVAIMANGRVIAAGPVDVVRQGQDLETRFVELVGGRRTAEGLSWLTN